MALTAVLDGKRIMLDLGWKMQLIYIASYTCFNRILCAADNALEGVRFLVLVGLCVHIRLYHCGADLGQPVLRLSASTGRDCYMRL